MTLFRSFALKISLTIFCISLTSQGARAEGSSAGLDLKGNLAQLPEIAESKDKGILSALLIALQNVDTEGKIDWRVEPFSTSLGKVIHGEADFHAPILRDPRKTDKDLGFALSSVTLWTVTFAIYVKQDAPALDLEHLEKYKIETENAHVSYFDFPTKGSPCLECSLRKVSSGEIDAFIFAAMESESVIKKFAIPNLKSLYYKAFEVKFALPLGERGAKVNAELTELVGRTAHNGDYKRILSPILDFYRGWAPRKHL